MMMRELVVCGVPFEEEDAVVRQALKELKEMGVTSVQIYTFWNMFEPNARGQFEWGHYDRQVNLLKEAGLKYVPFFLMGPRYAAPQWWIDSPDHRGMYCLEHHKYNPCESIWSPLFRREIERVIKAFAEHYLPMDVIESFQPGISGDYGESILPDIGNWPGSYHSHRGNWSGGEDAKEDFRGWLRQRFGTIERLNEAWRAHYCCFEKVEPFRHFEAPSRTAYFDYLEWYRGAMTNYTTYWLEVSRKYFPDLPVYMCTGGSEQPEHASYFSDQARACGKLGCGIRLTNEGNKFYDNFLWTSYCKSACDQYGAYFGLEPVGPITPNGVTTRIFGSAAYGNRQMFNYYSNLMEGVTPTQGAANFREYIHLVEDREPEPAIAMFWPGLFSAFFGANPDNPNDNRSIGIPQTVSDALTFLREQVNVMPVNEGMILDGGLSRYKVLVSPLAVFTRGEVLERIAQWVHDGGVLVSAGIMKDLEYRDVQAYIDALGLRPDYEVSTGHHEQFVQPGIGLPRLEAFRQYHCSMGVMGLQEGVEALSATEEGEGYAATKIARVYGATAHDYGQGKAILWMGPLAFKDDPDAIFPDPGWFKGLLADVIDRYAHLTDLTPAKGEVARAKIGEALYALTENSRIVKL